MQRTRNSANDLTLREQQSMKLTHYLSLGTIGENILSQSPSPIFALRSIKRSAMRVASSKKPLIGVTNGAFQSFFSAFQIDHRRDQVRILKVPVSVLSSVHGV